MVVIVNPKHLDPVQHVKIYLAHLLGYRKRIALMSVALKGELVENLLGKPTLKLARLKVCLDTTFRKATFLGHLFASNATLQIERLKAHIITTVKLCGCAGSVVHATFGGIKRSQKTGAIKLFCNLEGADGES